MQTTEKWKRLPRWPRYEVSTTGKVCNRKTGRMLRPILRRRSGHLAFYPRRGIRCYIHRAVLEAHVGLCPPGMECRHIDGNPSNNNLANLAWGARKENAQDTIRHGRRPRGEYSAFATMSNAQARVVRRLSNEGDSSRRLGKLLGVSHTTINKIVRGESYV